MNPSPAGGTAMFQGCWQGSSVQFRVRSTDLPFRSSKNWRSPRKMSTIPSLTRGVLEQLQVSLLLGLDQDGVGSARFDLHKARIHAHYLDLVDQDVWTVHLGA
jgi:hypothetical protein